jgi:O-antigen biosynthesis protein
VLAATPGGLALAPVDVPATLAAEEWHTDRRGKGRGRPVAGTRAEWQRLSAEVDDPLIDIRLLNGCQAHGDWLVFEEGDVSLRCFLHQLDFYLPLPGPRRAPEAEPDMLAALAAGCMVVLPPRYAGTFGEAALYAEGPATAETIRAARDHPAQRARGRAFVTANHHHGRYADRILALQP